MLPSVTSTLRRTTMEPRQAWIATAAVMVTVILSAIGATWVIGRNIPDMATREDVTQLQNEATRQRIVGTPPERRAPARVRTIQFGEGARAALLETSYRVGR